MTAAERVILTMLSAFLLTSVWGAVQYQGSKPGTSASSTFRWPEGKRAALSLSFDDARPSQIDVGLPILDRYKIKATFYVLPPRIKERLDGWKKAAAEGHEIGNHSRTHPCSGNFAWSRDRALESCSLDRMREELSGANSDIKEWLGITPRTFAYPCGQKFIGRGRNVKSYVPLVAELFLAGRGFMDEAPNDPLFVDPAQLNGVPSDNHDFQDIRPLIEQTLQNGGWLVLAGHEIGTGTERQTTQVSMLEDLFKYAAEPNRGLWIDTVAAVAGYIEKNRPAIAPMQSGTQNSKARP